jgi:hypothetical protein
VRSAFDLALEEKARWLASHDRSTTAGILEMCRVWCLMRGECWRIGIIDSERAGVTVVVTREDGNAPSEYLRERLSYDLRMTVHSGVRVEVHAVSRDDATSLTTHADRLALAGVVYPDEVRANPSATVYDLP